MVRHSAFRMAVLVGGLCVLGLFAAAPAAHAQATRTWVSGVGDDANPCSRTAPCKTFAGAISKTAAGGEINVLDPGGFGAVTITKSISIISQFEAGVLVSGTNGIVVNAGVNDVIILRGLDIEGLGTGLNGIRFLAGGFLFVENCTINNFNASGAGLGIDFEPSGVSHLYVSNTYIRNCRTATTGGGILIKPQAGGTAIATLENVRAERNNFGLKVGSAATVSVRSSVFSGNTNNGIIGVINAGPLSVSVDDSQISNNAAFGVLSSGAGATVRIGNLQVSGNGTGLGATSGGALLSFGNNLVSGNTADGAPTGTIGQL